jgi:hypothetical protein
MDNPIQGKLDQIAGKRLKNIRLVEMKTKKPEGEKDHWVISALHSPSLGKKLIGIALDIAIGFLPGWAQKLTGIIHQNIQNNK